MKKTLSLILALLIIASNFCIASAAEAFAPDSALNNTEFAVETAEIIKNSAGSSSMLRIMGRFSFAVSDAVFSQADDAVISDDGRFVLQFSTEEELLSCLEALNSNPYVLYAEQDRPIYTESLEKSTKYLSWAVEAIGADVYSDSIVLPSPDSSVTVAIIDSGSKDIDFIKDKLVSGYDFEDNDSDATDDESVDSHGTFLAGIVADCTRDLPVKIMPVRVLESKTGSLFNAVNGIYYAVDNGADIVNISLGGVMKDCRALDDALKYAEQKDVTVVVCAGNTKSDTENFCPAHNESAITVTSVNSENEFSSIFSNFGNAVDIAAPGENIISYNAAGQKVSMGGTSMSAAYVAAAAAMFRLKNPTCNAEQVRNAMISCAEDFGDEGWDKYYGWGILRIGKLADSAVKYVESVSVEKSSYYLAVGESITINPTISPADATDKTFTLSSNNNNITITDGTVTAVAEGKSKLTVTTNDGAYTYTVNITVADPANGFISTVKINNNTGSKTIDFGETLRLTAEAENMPENTQIWWYVNGAKYSEGETVEVYSEDKQVTVTVKLVDRNGNALNGTDGKEISDSETVFIRTGIFRMIISFFKNLFKLNRIIIQSVY